MSIDLIKDLRERWAEVGHHKTVEELNLEIEFYRKMLKIFQVGPSFFMIFNPPQARIEYTSLNIQELLGYTADEFTLDIFLRLIHEEDFPYFVEFEDTVVDFKLNLPTDKLMKYKSRYDYRIRKKDGSYIRVMQQSVTIQTNDEGAVLRNLVIFTDITPLKQTNKMTISFIGLDDEPSYFDVKTKGKYIPIDEIFTLREKEIIYLLSKNLSSNDIAKELNISPETVKTHRKRIHKKSGTSNVLELIMKAMKNGWI